MVKKSFLGSQGQGYKEVTFAVIPVFDPRNMHTNICFRAKLADKVIECRRPYRLTDEKHRPKLIISFGLWGITKKDELLEQY